MMNIETAIKATPADPFGMNYPDAWYMAAIMEGRDQLLDPSMTHHMCRDLGHVDLSIIELKAAIISAPAWMIWNGHPYEMVAAYIARILIAGKSGATGLPRIRMTPVAIG